MAIQGYDSWKLDYPPEYDHFPVCTACDVLEVEFEDEGLCGDCYYEQHHGQIIQMLDDATRHIQAHFENHKQADIKQANAYISIALQQVQALGGQRHA